MRILVHDFGGYAFPVALSRSLAQRGHTVMHAYCASLETTPRGPLQPRPDDPAGLTIQPLALGEPLQKYRLVQRWRQENAFGQLVVEAAARFRPDVVLSGNAPLDAQRRLARWCRDHSVRFVFWVQDLIGEAAHRLLRQKHAALGATVGRYYRALERRLLRASDAAVVITDDFRPLLRQTGLSDTQVHTIENWAPLEDLDLRPADNAWADAQGLKDKTVLLYSGTLGMKHNPALLLDLARRYRARPDVRVVVVSQGLGADWLRAHRAPDDPLEVLEYQPFDQLPNMLATADVLLAVLEPDAGVFSVPSKVLTYLCAARPVLLAVPPGNLAARIVTREQAGLAVDPAATDAWLAAADRLLGDATLRKQMGHHARRYAETAFDIARITDRFEAALAA